MGKKTQTTQATDGPAPEGANTPGHGATGIRERLAAVPEELKRRPHWVVWKQEGTDKVPYTPHKSGSGPKAKTSDPGTGRPFNEAVACFEKGGAWDGLGLILTDGLVGLDLDHVLEGGVPDETARMALEALGTYTEVSPSEGGLKFFGRGRASHMNGHECYDGARFFTVTGNAWDGAPSEVNDIHDALRELSTRIPPKPSEDGVSGETLPHMDKWEGTWDQFQDNSIVWWTGKMARAGRTLAEVEYAFTTKFKAGDIPNLDPNHPWRLEEILRTVRRIYEANEKQKEEARGQVLRNNLGLMTWDDLAEVEWDADFWLLDERIQSTGINMRAGPVFGGKSLMEKDISVGLVTGTECLLGTPREPVNVLYLGGDNGLRPMRMRFEQLLHGRGLTEMGPGKLIVTALPFNLGDDEIFEVIRRTITENSVAYTVVDLLSAYSGGINLDRGYEVRPYLNRLIQLTEELRTAVSIVVRENKSKPMTNLDSVSHSTEIPGAADTVYGLTPKTSQDDEVTIITVKSLKNRVTGESKPLFAFMAIPAGGGIRLVRTAIPRRGTGVGKAERAVTLALQHLETNAGEWVTSTELMGHLEDQYEFTMAKATRTKFFDQLKEECQWEPEGTSYRFKRGPSMGGDITLGPGTTLTDLKEGNDE